MLDSGGETPRLFRPQPYSARDMHGAQQLMP